MSRRRKPVGVLFQADGGADYPDEYYVFPPVWEEEVYSEIGVDLSDWTADLDREPLAGPYLREQDAKAALTRLQKRAKEAA